MSKEISEKLMGTKKVIGVSDMSMYESFVGNEHIEMNCIIEGMIAGYNGVESVNRREWMEQHLEPLVMWVKNVSYVDKLDTDDATLVLKAMIYFCEMNQDKHNNSVLDGFKNFLAHYTTAKKISDISSFSSIGFYIPELKTMHPYTQSIIKHIMGEMYLILVHALLNVDGELACDNVTVEYYSDRKGENTNTYSLEDKADKDRH